MLVECAWCGSVIDTPRKRRETGRPTRYCAKPECRAARNRYAHRMFEGKKEICIKLREQIAGMTTIEEVLDYLDKEAHAGGTV